MSNGSRLIALQGRRLEIALGRTDLPLSLVMLYRQRWASQGHDLPPLDASSEAFPSSDIQPRRAVSSKCTGCGNESSTSSEGPGSQLLRLYADAGVPHCQACHALAAKMDQWGPEQCAERIDEIVNDMLPRAKQWLADNRPWVRRLLAGVGAEGLALRTRLTRDVGKAIEQAITAKPLSTGIIRGRAGFRPRNWTSPFTPQPGVPRFITSEQFSKDTLALVSELPPDITAVAGVSRSGLHPATMIAMMLHVPLIVIRHHQADWFPAGNGWRLNEGAPKNRELILVVDDTTMTGNSLERTKHVIANMPGRKIFASIYVNPAAKSKPDIWAVDLPWPHLLQWNLFNSVMVDSCSFDFDGVLCQDCPIAQDDDGEGYQRFLSDARPLHLIRKRRIGLIVTSRLEKYRGETLAWLKKWRIDVDKLEMGPWKTLRERRGDDVAAFKASRLREWYRKKSRVSPRVYVESDPRQAKRIAELTGGLVACPNGQCFRGRS